jgi:hypothetical protein
MANPRSWNEKPGLRRFTPQMRRDSESKRNYQWILEEVHLLTTNKKLLLTANIL